MMFRPRVLALACGVAAVIGGTTPSRATMPPRAGPLPVEVAAAMRAGVLELPAARAPGGARGATVTAAVPVQGAWRVPVLLVSYSDSAMIWRPADFNQFLFDTTGATATGAIYDYYQWVSGGRLRVIPTVVATVTLAKTRAYYGYNSWGLSSLGTPRNDAGLVNDALAICNRSVDWTRFDRDHDGFVDMLWVVHAGIGGEGSRDRNDLWSITSRLSSYWSLTEPFDATVPGGPRMFIDRFSIVPELSVFVPRQISEIGVYCHEFGHALGLPDLYDTQPFDGVMRNSGPGNWSLMSTGAYGGDGISPQFPSHPGAWCTLFLGWSQSFRPEQDTLVTLPPIQRGGSVLDLWFQGEPGPEHFLAECRHRDGFDRRVPGDGMVLYHINEVLMGQRLPANNVNVGPEPALVVVEADGRGDLSTGWDRGDSTDVFPGPLQRTLVTDDLAQPSTASFRFEPTNIALLDIAARGDSVRFVAQVRAPGWRPAVDRTDADFLPLGGSGPAASAVVDPQGTLSCVGSEPRGGNAQVILRTRVRGVWQPALQLSHSSANALDPSVALLPGGDLAVAWSDTRAGHARLFYRARVRGVWTDEQPLLDLPGESLSPAIGADARGAVQVAWIYVAGGRAQILFARFAYLSPFGPALAVSGASALPGAPALGVAPDGSSFVVWADQATRPQALRFASFRPDSGLGPALSLTQPAGVTQQIGNAIVDAQGALHTVWTVSGPGVNGLHYQRRMRGAAPSPADTTLYVEGGVALNPRVAADPQGGIHLVYQAQTSGATQIRYRHWQPARGWDAGGTEVTLPADGDAERPIPLPTSPGNLTVLFTGYSGAGPRFMERDRLLDTPAPLAVAPAPPPPVLLSIGPNPLRAGEALRLGWAGSAAGGPAVVDIFDLSGRRLTSVSLAPAAPDGLGGRPGLSGALPAATTGPWPSGVYFARLRGSRAPAARLVYLR